MKSTDWIWCDFENTPQVLFLEPIVDQLRTQGLDVRVTAKPQGQTLELARARGIPAEPVGGGDFKRLHQKVVGNIGRAVALRGWVRRQGTPPSVLISSSRSASFAAWLMGIRARAMLDYEYAEQRTLRRSERMWLPDLLATAELHPGTRRKASFYEGLKENLYLDGRSISREEARRTFGAADDDYLVVARPAAEAAHYAAEDSSRYWQHVIDGLSAKPRTKIIVMPRNGPQQERMQSSLARYPRLEVLSRVVDGPELVAAADLVVSAGGTMNREAAVLGTPAWSTFCGPAPHIDECLHREGRLRWIRSESELHAALDEPLPGRMGRRGPFRAGLEAIVADLVASANGAKSPAPANER